MVSARSGRWNRKSTNKRCSQRKSPCTAIRTIGCIKTVRWEEIQSEELIAVGNESVPMISATAGVRIKPKMTVEHMATAMSLAAQCEGVVIAETFSRHYAKSYQLATCSLTPPLRRNMNLYFHAWRAQTPATQRFKEFLFRYMDEHHDARPASGGPGIKAG